MTVCKYCGAEIVPQSATEWSYGPTKDGIDQVWASKKEIVGLEYTLRCESAPLTQGITKDWRIHQPKLLLADILAELRFIQSDLRP